MDAVDCIAQRLQRHLTAWQAPVAKRTAAYVVPALRKRAADRGTATICFPSLPEHATRTQVWRACKMCGFVVHLDMDEQKATARFATCEDARSAVRQLQNEGFGPAHLVLEAY